METHHCHLGISQSTPCPSWPLRKQFGQIYKGLVPTSQVQCECRATIQFMSHLKSCPSCKNTCTREDLNMANDRAVKLLHIGRKYNSVLTWKMKEFPESNLWYLKFSRSRRKTAARVRLYRLYSYSLYNRTLLAVIPNSA